MNRSAIISACGSYRYSLRREWNPNLPSVLFVGLNPSTATATIDDPTIRRCIGFARDWGFGSLLMANLFAYRATSASVLSSVADPVGPKNKWWLSFLRNQTKVTVAAWGVNGSLFSRDQDVIKALSNLHCLGKTKEGYPRHPLYLPASAKMIPYRG